MYELLAFILGCIFGFLVFNGMYAKALDKFIVKCITDDPNSKKIYFKIFTDILSKKRKKYERESNKSSN